MPQDNRESRKVIKEILIVWGDLYKIEITSMTVVTYCSALEDYTADELRHAAEVITKNHKFKSLPLPGSFTELIKIERKEGISKQIRTNTRLLLEAPVIDPELQSGLAGLCYELIGSKLSQDEIEAKFQDLRNKFHRDPKGFRADTEARQAHRQTDKEKKAAHHDAMMKIEAKDKADFIEKTEAINKQFGLT